MPIKTGSIKVGDLKYDMSLGMVGDWMMLNVFEIIFIPVMCTKNV